jgi:hypothetical protein
MVEAKASWEQRLRCHGQDIRLCHAASKLTSPPLTQSPRVATLEPKPLAIASDIRSAETILQGLVEQPGKSSATLLKHPDASTPSSWHLWLPPHFNSALDLRFLQKQKTKNKEVVQTWREWVQGGRFQFNEGAIIYDRDVSALRTWGEKLKVINFYILIQAARPVTVKASQDQETGLRRMRRNSGLVTFVMFAAQPNGGEAESNPITMTQDAFVRFAITGQR